MSETDLKSQIKEMILKNHTYLHYGMLMSASDNDAANEITNDIISRILSLPSMQDEEEEISHTEEVLSCPQCHEYGFDDRISYCPYHGEKFVLKKITTSDIHIDAKYKTNSERDYERV